MFYEQLLIDRLSLVPLADLDWTGRNRIDMNSEFWPWTCPLVDQSKSHQLAR
jgi:hypothetical protein